VIRFQSQAREFYVLQSVQIGSMAHSAAFRVVEEDPAVAVKRLGRDAVFCCPVRDTENKIIRHSLEYNISSSGENSTLIGEYRSSYSASP
jgi:hypothetical protein